SPSSCSATLSLHDALPISASRAPHRASNAPSSASLCPPFSHPPARSFLHSVRASALTRTALLLRRPSALLRMLHGRRLRCGHQLIDPVAARPYKPPPAWWPVAAYKASRRAVTCVTRGAYKVPPRYTRDQLAQEALPPETLRPASGAPTGG